jgi:hypothetical protein
MLLLTAIFLFIAPVYAQTAAAGNSECVRVTASSATLRGRPSVSGKALDVVAKNTQLEAIAKRNIWTLVQTEDYAGWLEAKWLEPCVSGTESKTPILGSIASGPAASPTSTPVTAPSQQSTSESHIYTRGPKGGCYYMSSSGRKVYVDHSLCN